LVYRCVNIYIDIDIRVCCFVTINIKRDDINDGKS